jgi:hypothetical protein
MAGKDGESILRKVVTLSDVAALTVQSERSVQRLVKSGVIRLAKDRQRRQLKGRFVLGECIPKICEHLRDLATADDPHATAYAEARAARMAAMAEREQLDLRLRRGELHRSDDIQFVIGGMIVAARDRLRAIPSRLMHSLRGETDPLKINKAIGDEIDAALLELSERKVRAMLSPKALARHLRCSEAEARAVINHVESANDQEPDEEF